MYKYKCSKKDCGNIWTVQEGCLNGFTLTCPLCGKGRGLFISQVKGAGETDGKRKQKEDHDNEEV
jgi:uncharacterized protein (DUF983 family)